MGPSAGYCNELTAQDTSCVTMNPLPPHCCRWHDAVIAYSQPHAGLYLALYDNGAPNGPIGTINGKLGHLHGIALGFRSEVNYISRSLVDLGALSEVIDTPQAERATEPEMIVHKNLEFTRYLAQCSLCTSRCFRASQ